MKKKAYDFSERNALLSGLLELIARAEDSGLSPALDSEIQKKLQQILQSSQAAPRMKKSDLGRADTQEFLAKVTEAMRRISHLK